MLRADSAADSGRRAGRRSSGTAARGRGGARASSATVDVFSFSAGQAAFDATVEVAPV
jgi:hypothetical protein